MLKLVCASHSPLLLNVAPTKHEQKEQFYAAVDKMSDFVRSYNPELIVVFGPDHFNGFFHDLMPQYCVGFSAVGAEDWDIELGELNVPTEMARELVDFLLSEGIDVATSYRMKVDHGFTVALNLLTKGLDAYPTIPIFINCNSSPRASCKRSRQLGESVGRYFATMKKRVLLVGSGGLSHDPPNQPYDEAPPELKNYLVGDVPWNQEFEKRRQARVKAAAKDLVGGLETILPPSRSWDERILDVVVSQKLVEADSFTDDWITKNGGRGGHEIRAWVAAFAALGVQGRYRAEVVYYDVVMDWATGMSVVQAEV